MAKVRSAFLRELASLPVTALVPARTLDPRERSHQKYKQIASSIASIGVIEPVVVFPMDGGKYRVLDGGKRLAVLIELKIQTVDCLVATDDEGYTYNKRTNYLSPVSEHLMILRALKHNTEQTIAKALAVDVDVIRRKRDLLRGICVEVVTLFKDKRVSPAAFPTLRKMKPTRQVEVAQLMIASGVYSGRFATALLAGTRTDLLVEGDQERTSRVLPGAHREQMEQETDILLRDLKAVEASYGEEVLALTISCRYLRKILDNTTLRGYLKRHYVTLHDEITSIVSLVDGAPA